MPLLPPLPDEENPQHFCTDKGYDYDDIRSIIVLFLYQDHIKARREEKKDLKRLVTEPEDGSARGYIVG
jgi:hypothetical protein